MIEPDHNPAPAHRGTTNRGKRALRRTGAILGSLTRALQPGMPALLLLFAVPLPALTNLSPEQRLLAIRTVTAQPDGQVFENRGSGVIVGPYYLTVYHNLDPRPAALRRGLRRGRSFLGNEQVNPVYSDPSSDVAILPLPATMCAGSCREPAPTTRVLPRLNQPVRWYLGTADTPSGGVGWHRGRILAQTIEVRSTVTAQRAEAGATRPAERDECAAGLVYEVDAPFFPGSSGMAIWDDNDNLLGIAQGSYEYADGRRNGYFRPWYCIQQHWPGQLRMDAPRREPGPHFRRVNKTGH